MSYRRKVSDRLPYRQTVSGNVLRLEPDHPPAPRYLGPRWSRMTRRERHLYGVPGGLSEAELDAIWRRSA